MKSKRGFVSFLALILTLAVICIFGYFMYRAYFNFPSSGVTTEFPQSPGKQKNMPNPVAAIENVKQKISAINEEQLKRQKELEESLNR